MQVRDLAIDARQGEVAIATHGRAFWVLDNLALLEQMSLQPAGAPTTEQVLRRKRHGSARLRHESHREVPARRGSNPPFGATVFFHIPETYHGKVPVSLSFLDDQGHVVRTVALHLKAKEPKLTPAQRDNLTPIEQKHQADEKLTADHRRLQPLPVGLRYPDATEVTGSRRRRPRAASTIRCKDRW